LEDAGEDADQVVRGQVRVTAVEGVERGRVGLAGIDDGDSAGVSARRAGRRSRMSVIRSPRGSMTTAPRPARTSSQIMLRSRVDLPVPVLPTRWMWRRVSATGRATGWAPVWAWPRVLVFRPPVGTATGAGMGLARARSRPGTAVSVGHTTIPAPVPDDVWRSAEILAILRRRPRDAGAILRIAADHAGSQERIAQRISEVSGRYVQPSRINRLINRKQHANEIDSFADGLDMPDHARLLWGLAPRSVAPVAAPGQLERSLIHICGADDEFGGDALLALASGHLRRVQWWLRAGDYATPRT
jgi:hypothetical protein